MNTHLLWTHYDLAQERHARYIAESLQAALLPKQSQTVLRQLVSQLNTLRTRWRVRDAAEPLVQLPS